MDMIVLLLVSCVCSATRAVAVLAEARAHALAGTRSAADRAAVLGSEDCQALMQQLQDRMLAIASDTGMHPGNLLRVVFARRVPMHAPSCARCFVPEVCSP
jgi:hypothetical protein